MPNVHIDIIFILLAITFVQAQQPDKHQLALQGLSTFPQPPPPSDAPAATAVCSVHIIGTNKRLSRATVACSAGSITAASDSDTASALLQQGSTGVSWTTVEGCGLESRTCLLAICGVDSDGLLDLDLTVSGYVDVSLYLWGVVCVSGNARVSIKVSP